MTIINIANDFSVYPGGRYPSDGDHSGEEFRDNFLIPLLEKGSAIQIELDGTRGYGSSFLEETFGGLVRLGYSPNQLFESLTLVSSKESLIKEIKSYILDAAKK